MPSAGTEPSQMSGGPSPPSSSAATAPLMAPPEVEATLQRLTAHKNVHGVMVLSRADGLVIRNSGAAFEGDRGKRYIRMVTSVVDAAARGVEDMTEGDDELRFLRLRLRKHELMISPDPKYVLVVLRDPS